MPEPHAYPQQEPDLEPHSVRRVFYVGVGITVIVIALAAWGALEVLSVAGTITSTVPPAPLESVVQQTDVEQEIFDLEAAGLERNEVERAELASYGWVDQERGMVRLPIDRAMSIVAEEIRSRQATQGELPSAAELGANPRPSGVSPRTTPGGSR